MATRIDPNGTETTHQPTDPRGFSLAELYRLTDCSTVEAVELADGRVMWLDEEGKVNGRTDANAKATALLREAGGIPGDVVLGPVLVTTADEVE